MIDVAPDWVIVETQTSSEELVERGLRVAGYRVYVPRYRKSMSPHGQARRGPASMRPLFSRLVFAQDWRGWPELSISGARGLMRSSPGVARLVDADVALIMHRERAGEFDELRHPRGSGKYIRDDIIPGDEVDLELFGRRVMAVLTELTPGGKAVIEALLFDRMVRTEVDAETLRRVVPLAGAGR